eukprot:GEZU01018952.1.p1 GENE.GEZU01018952.1~~GEZU01018952.1.p1  ORF type:complete len:215 (-),score=51.94 GEZU01018952.1:647-1291(-)
MVERKLTNYQPLQVQPPQFVNPYDPKQKSKASAQVTNTEMRDFYNNMIYDDVQKYHNKVAVLSSPSSTHSSPRGSPATSPTKTVMRQFIAHPFTSQVLRVGDRVLIVVAEDFQILGTDPDLHGKIGFIVSFSSDQSEAQIRLKASSTDLRSVARSGEIVSVPCFFLCLEDKDLYPRLKGIDNVNYRLTEPMADAHPGSPLSPKRYIDGFHDACR